MVKATVIGMTDAAKRLGLTDRATALRLLKRHEAPLIRIHNRAWAIDETDLEKVMQNRKKRGRKPGSKNKPKPTEPQAEPGNKE